MCVVAAAVQAVWELFETCRSSGVVSFSFAPNNILILQSSDAVRPRSLRRMSAPYVIDCEHECIAMFVDCSRMKNDLEFDIKDVIDYSAPSC